jgi:hypothetical protein
MISDILQAKFFVMLLRVSLQRKMQKSEPLAKETADHLHVSTDILHAAGYFKKSTFSGYL